MPESLEERVAYLEGKVSEHSRGFDEVRELVVHLDQRLSSRLDATNTRIDALDQKVDRFREELSSRIDALDHRLTGRIDALDQKVSMQFRWLVGIQIAVLLAVIGALLGT